MISHWQRRKDVLLDALELPTARRTEYLDRLDAVEPTIIAEVRRLLAAPVDAIVTGAPDSPFELWSAPEATRPERVGNFEVLDELGSGGMGVVYHARQTEPVRREVALKILRGGRRRRNEFTPDGESDLLASLNHSCIAKVFDAGWTEDGEPFLAMELVAGARLDEFVRSAELDPRDCVRLFVQICQAVEYAHERSIIHCDLKPSNIMITRENDALLPKVIDFGIATLLESDRSPSRRRRGVGTPGYMSPEQAVGEIAGPSTDVYALGTVLHEMLTGRRPFEARDRESTVEHWSDAIRDASNARIDEKLPDDLGALIRRCVAVAPEERYSSVTALREDLERYLDHRPLVGVKASTPYRLRKWVRRHRTMVAVAGVIVVALGIAGGLGYSSHLREQRVIDRTLPLRDQRILAEVRAEARQLFPVTADLVPEIEQWLIERAAPFRSKLADHRNRLDRVRGEALAVARDSAIALELESRIAVLEALISELRSFLTDPIPLDTVPNLERRLELARELRTAASDEVTVAWRRAAERVAADERFGDFQLTPQVGLVPIGPDPKSGLEEFAHRPTGRTPSRSEDGTLEPQRGDAIVLVLVPGGVFRMGAQAPSLGIAGQTIDGRLRVADLVPGELATRLGIEVGDVVISLQDRSVNSVAAILPVLAHTAPDTTIRASVERDGEVIELEAPSGPDWMDPLAANFERPTHEVTLDPFFISKYEITEDQWCAITGRWSEGGPPKGQQSFPAPDINWVLATKALPRVGLTLPTEAQWEFATRAGTKTYWWTGNDKENLRGAANLVDHFCRLNGGNSQWKFEDWLDDGWAGAAPVGTYRANPFGLHETTGNLAELCLDPFGSYFDPKDPGTGLRPRAMPRGLTRGGSWGTPAVYARSAHRQGIRKDVPYSNTTVRPVRPLD